MCVRGARFGDATRVKNASERMQLSTLPPARSWYQFLLESVRDPVLCMTIEPNRNRSACTPEDFRHPSEFGFVKHIHSPRMSLICRVRMGYDCPTVVQFPTYWLRRSLEGVLFLPVPRRKVDRAVSVSSLRTQKPHSSAHCSDHTMEKVSSGSNLALIGVILVAAWLLQKVGPPLG
jgi:hypothetical protein